MERAPYWTLKKRVHDQYLDESWEERAFAEDAAGMLGGCVWPPRSYSCTFCKREFRSAQALGGHMNVHRRDRARLKQFSTIPNDQMLNPHQDSTYLCKSCPSLMVTYPTQDFALVHDSNPNPNSHHHTTTAVSVHQKMTASISQENKVGSEPILTPHIPPCFGLNQKKHPSFTSSGDDRFDSNNNKELGSKYEMHHERSSLSISLVFQQSCPTEDILRKRRKLEVSPQRVTPIVSGIYKAGGEISKVDGLKSSSLEELDLELRLGSTQPI